MIDNKATNIPKVSVCIPAYNNADYIEETIHSVLASDLKDLELIVVDDNSTDGTFEKLQRIKQELGDERLILYRNEQNLGMSGNWNKALSLCQGDYIKLLCADDLIDPSLLQKEAAILDADSEIITVATDTVFQDLNGQTKKFVYKRYHKSGKIDGREACRFSVFTRDYLGAPLANTFRRSAYERLGGFDPDFKYIVDYDFFMKLYSAGYVYILHEKLNFFRVRSDSNTGKVMGGGEEEAYIDEHKRLIQKYQKVLGLANWQVGLSVNIRRFMSFLGNIYLKVSVPKENPYT